MKRICGARLLFMLVLSAAVLICGGKGAYGAEVEHYGPLRVHVQLEKVYLDGDVGIEHTDETVLAMEDFWASYAGWTLVEQKKASSFSVSMLMTFLRSVRLTVISASRTGASSPLFTAVPDRWPSRFNLSSRLI